MITGYHRPATIDDAVALLAATDSYMIVDGAMLRTIPTAESTTAVDLQQIGIADITTSGTTAQIGSMTTLADIASSRAVPAMIAELAQREEPSTMRTATTIGGVILANDHESELLAGLVAFGATVDVVGQNGTSNHTLEAILADPTHVDRSVITAVTLDIRGSASAHRTGRTPMDRPIVMVVGVKDAAGHIRLGMTGVSDRVVALSPGQTNRLAPPGDFRGTSEYRLALVQILTKRVLTDLGGGGS